MPFQYTPEQRLSSLRGPDLFGGDERDGATPLPVRCSTASGVERRRMGRIFITGSADGLGRAAAQTLLRDGHEVIVHARNRDRLTAVRDLLDRGAAAVV